jgi:hypothetical protein
MTTFPFGIDADVTLTTIIRDRRPDLVGCPVRG